jgi:hypothetical protein
MNAQSPLGRELSAHEELKVRLKEQFPEADDQTLLDTLEGETSLVEVINRIAESAMDDETLAKAAKERAAEIVARSKRFSARAESKWNLVQWAMEKSERKKIEAASFTLSLGAKPKTVIVISAPDIPKGYMRTPEPLPPKPDLKAILEALKDGKSIEGCTLSNGGTTLTVRTK